MPVDFQEEVEPTKIDFVEEAQESPSAGLPDLEAVDAMLSRQESMRKIVPGPSVTAGGPPVAVAPLSVAWQEPGEELTRPALRFSELVPPVRPDESVPSAAVKTLGRVALSVPEFFTSPLGITTAIAGPAAPKLTAGLFAADMLRGVPKEATAIGAQWDRMTPAQKTEAVISLGASALMGAGLGAKALGGILPKAKIAAPEPPPLPEVPPEPPPPIPKAVERVVEDYVEPEPTEVAVKAEEMAAKPAEQPAVKAAEPEKGAPVETVTAQQPAMEGLPVGGIGEETLSKAASMLSSSPEERALLKTISNSGIPFYTSIDQVPNAPNLRYHGTWAQSSGAIIRNGFTQGMSHNYESFKGVGGIGDVTFMFDAGHPEIGVVSSSDIPHGKPIGVILNGNPNGTVNPAKIKYAIDKAQQKETNATQERKVEESVQREREGTDAQRIPPETGTSDSLQPEAQVGPEEAEVLLTPEPSKPAERVEGVAKAQAAFSLTEGKPATYSGRERIEFQKQFEGRQAGADQVTVELNQHLKGGKTWDVEHTYYAPPGHKYPIKVREPIAMDVPLKDAKAAARKWLEGVTDSEAGGKAIRLPAAEPAAKTGEGAPMPEGPGALTAGTSPTGKSQIEQLADAFRNKAPTRDRAAALVRQSFDYGARQAQAKDAVSRAISGLKAAADKTWQLLSSFEKPDDLLKAKGVLSAELETRGWRVRQFVKNVKQAMPDVKRRAAISKWIEAGGDVAELQRGEAATKPQFKQAYRDAQRLTPEEQIAAQNVSNYFEARLQEAIDEGILEHGLDDYIHRIYQRDPVLQKKAFAYVQSGILSKNPSLAKKRMFQFDWEAERAGKLPVQDFVERVADYETSLSKAIAARKFIRQMTQLHASDGRPVIGIKGVGIPIEDQQGVRTGTIIKPLGDFTKNAKAYAVEDANGQIVAYFDKLPSADAHAASIGGRAIDNPHYRGDYINREFNALSKWKWVGTDTDGKPIFLQGDVAIHPDFAGRIDALLKPSQIRYGSHPGLSAVGRVALGIGSTFKQTMLDLSGFHQVQIAVHGLEHRVWALPTGKAPPGFAKIVKDVDFEDPNVQGLLKGGVTLGGEYHASNYGEGLFGKALTQHVPVLGPVLESYHSWLFQDFIPRVKMTMALHALERNKARYRKELASGRMTEDDLNFLTAKQANAAFGELNYTMMERNKTLQDMARIVMLAPDFLEARAKFVAQAANWKYGKEQRVALLLGATTLWALARAGNMILDGQPHNEPENLFNIVYGNNAYSLRTVQGDVLHAATKRVQFWLNRLNPVYTRTLLELIAQRDQFGRKRDFWQVIGDTASNIVPISLRSSRERHLWESILNSIGVTAKRWNDVKRASDLAQEWKKASRVRSEPGEFIYDPDKDPMRGLKIALSEQDEGGAVKEIKRLLESKATTEQKLTEHFKRYANAHFAGTAANERKFMASLTDDQKKTVLGAYQHRKAMFQLYRRALSQYFATR